MKKVLIILLALIILPLSACTQKKAAIENDQQVTTVKKNKISWKKQTNDLPIIKYNGSIENQKSIANSMENLTKNNQYVVKGTVYKLSRLDNIDNQAFTKVEFHVDEVIHGTKTLKNQNINLAMSGGITTSNSWYKNKNQTREADHDILVQYRSCPLPKIGAEMIIGLNPTNVKESTNYMKTLKKNDFDLKKTFKIGMPEYNIWIKNPQDNKFHLNNPRVDSKLTKQINQNYNK